MSELLRKMVLILSLLLFQARTLTAKVIEERNSVVEQNKKLRQELVWHFVLNVYSVLSWMFSSAILIVILWFLMKFSFTTSCTIWVALKNYRLVEPCHAQELLRRAPNRSGGGIPFMYVVIVGLVGIILGYLLKRTWLMISRFNRMIKIVENNKKQNVWYGKTNYTLMLLSCIVPRNLDCVMRK